MVTTKRTFVVHASSTTKAHKKEEFLTFCSTRTKQTCTMMKATMTILIALLSLFSAQAFAPDLHARQTSALASSVASGKSKNDLAKLDLLERLFLMSCFFYHYQQRLLLWAIENTLRNACKKAVTLPFHEPSDHQLRRRRQQQQQPQQQQHPKITLPVAFKKPALAPCSLACKPRPPPGNAPWRARKRRYSFRPCVIAPRPCRRILPRRNGRNRHMFVGPTTRFLPFFRLYRKLLVDDSFFHSK